MRRAQLTPIAITLIASFGVVCTIAQTANPQSQRAGDRYQNVQILRDTTASDLMRTMQVMRVSLGAHCDFCHDVDHYEADTKPQKATARRMIQMVLDLNRTSFGGRTVVTCNTCHRGSTQPVAIPTVEQGLFPDQTRSPLAPAVPLPSPSEIFDRYFTALGGRAALLAVQSRVAEGTTAHLLIGTGDTGQPRAINRGQTDSITVKTTGPLDFSLEMGGPQPQTIVVQGGKGTVKAGATEAVLGQDDIDGVAMKYALRQELALASEAGTFATRERVVRDGRTLVVLERRRANGLREQLQFDVADGLLRRRTTFKTTPIGDDPIHIDFDDYRLVDGVRVPFVIKTSYMDDNHYGTTVTFTSVRQEVRRAPQPRH